MNGIQLRIHIEQQIVFFWPDHIRCFLSPRKQWLVACQQPPGCVCICRLHHIYRPHHEFTMICLLGCVCVR